MASVSMAGAITLSAGVIRRARARGRRRRLTWLAASAAVAAAASSAGGVLAGGASQPRSDSVRPSALLAQSPDIGIACGAPGCDRIGLAVWLRRPARSVTAVVNGRRFALSTRLASAFQPGPAARAKMFIGYAHMPVLFTHLHVRQGPPLDWWASKSSQWPSPRIAIRVSPIGGGSYTTALAVELQGGWG